MLTTALMVLLAAHADGKAVVTLPKGGRHAELMLTSTWFSNGTVLGPIGGPTHGYDVALETWPERQVLLLAGSIGKAELERDPLFRLLEKPKLKLLTASDGHAAAWSLDGSTWRAAFIDGPTLFTCTHRAVNPTTLPTTRTQVLDVFTHSAEHPVSALLRPNRVELTFDALQEFRGALAWATRPGTDAEVVSAAFAWLLSDTSELLRSLDEVSGANCAGLAKPEQVDALEKRGAPKAFIAALRRPRVDAEPARKTTTSPASCELAPAITTESRAPLTLDVLERLRVPERADARSCASWKALRPLLNAQAQLVADTPLPSPAKKRMFTTMCGANVVATASGTQHHSVWSAGLKVNDSYARAVERCGHVDKPDAACEAAALVAAKKERLVAIDAARKAECSRVRDALEVARACLETYEVIVDSFGRSDAAQAWVGVSMLHAASEPLFCPPPEWP